MKSQSMNLGLEYNFYDENVPVMLRSLELKKDKLVEFIASDSNLFISGIMKTEEDNFSGTYDFQSALNLFSKEFEARFLHRINKKQFVFFCYEPC